MYSIFKLNNAQLKSYSSDLIDAEFIGTYNNLMLMCLHISKNYPNRIIGNRTNDNINMREGINRDINVNEYPTYSIIINENTTLAIVNLNHFEFHGSEYGELKVKIRDAKINMLFT